MKKSNQALKPIYYLGFPLLFIFLFSISCCQKNPDPNDDPVDEEQTSYAKVWMTKADQTSLLDQTADLPIKEYASANWPVLLIDSSIHYQSIDGYGAALTGSSAYLLNNKLSADKLNNTLKSLFDPETGIGISYLRLSMGASDFSLSDFSYNDLPAGETDFELENFSLAKDQENLIPILKEIQKIQTDIKLMGSPWSPPAWMKTSNNMVGGKLKESCYDVYANYFVKYIQSMASEGFTIDAITPQNEPLHFSAGYPCMEMQSEDQLTFIKDHLGPGFESSGIETKIVLYDHNWDHPEYPIQILNDPDAKKYVAGSGFHAYAGNVSAMSEVHNAHPDKDLYFTEISGGDWATNFGDNLMWNMKNIFIGTANNWSKNALLWNLALDQNFGPKNNGCSNCRGVITIHTDSDKVDLNEEYYAIGHFSKFVRPGAVRIKSTIPQDLTGLELVAFMNTDGSKVLVICNSQNAHKVFSVSQGNNNFSYTAPARSVVSIVW
jgi:glucosylceramidase